MPTALLVAHHYSPHVGGLELVVERQAHSLIENGYRVFVLTSQFGSAPQIEEPRTGLQVVRVGSWHVLERLFFIPFPLFSPCLIAAAWKLVKEADIVHVHDVFYISSWIAAVLAVIARKPMVMTQHVAMVDHPSRLIMWAQSFVYATAGRWIFRRARSIVVYNENVRAFLRSSGIPNDRILQMNNGVNTALFRPASTVERQDARARFGLPQDRALVLFVGRLVEKKGYKILLEARDPAFDLVFVGPGQVSAHAEANGSYFLGQLDQHDAALAYRACDLFAFPAIGEIFTLAMQEAMASGLPVITTDDPAYVNSVVSEHVELCRREPESFRRAILDLVADRSRAIALGRHGRELAVQHFDWHGNFSGLMKMYSEILSSPSVQGD